MNTSSQAHLSQRPARVTVIGDALVEVHRDERGSREFVGGRGVDAAIGLSVLGDEATLVAAVGGDEDGDRVRSVLGDYGVRLVAVASASGTRRVVVERTTGDRIGMGIGRDLPEREEGLGAGALGLDEAARTTITGADLVVVTGLTLTDPLVDELIAALERPGLRLVVDAAAPAGMPRADADLPARLDRLATSALFTVPADDDAPVAAVAHLLARGVAHDSPAAWDAALDAASATLAATALPGRTAPRPRPAPTDQGS
ncbi:hypothetical protein [Agromyces sp. NPDC058064]|uniref:hypothetical protein n=1 Tax=Agromyces sp. NPDC058064 TaxID=3346322 RepID=UPI0036DC4722